MVIKSEKVIQLASVGGIIMLLVSNIYELSYYRTFHINIFEYEDFSEIISLWIPNIGIILPILFGFVVLVGGTYFLFSFFVKSQFKAKSDSDPIITKKTEWKESLILFFKSTLVCFPFVIIIQAPTFIKIIYPEYFSQYSSATMQRVYNGIVILMGLAFIRYRILFDPPNNQQIRILLSYSFALIFIWVTYSTLSACGSLDAEITKESKQKMVVIAYFKDSIIRTNDTCKYIGGNKYYMFFHIKDGSKQHSIILKRKILSNL